MAFESKLTEGNVVKQLIKFSLPLLLTNIIQACYSVADMMIVGWFDGTNAVSAVNIGSQIAMVVTNFVIGLAVGGTILIAQYIGADKKAECETTIGTLLSVMGLLSVLFTAGVIIFAEPLLGLLNTPVESFQMAKEYLVINMAGLVFVFGYNAISAILRGMGNSRNPLVFVSIACATNVVLDIICVGPLDMGAAGAAWATIASQGLSMFLAMSYLRRNNFVFNFRLKSFRIDTEKLKLLLKVGIPTSVQNVIVGISFLVLTSVINSVGGVTASAAVGIVGKFNGFAILPAVAMSAAVSAMGAQNIGAGYYKRAAQTLWTAIGISMSISLLIFAFVQFFPEAILNAFKAEEDVMAIGIQYLKSFSWDYLIVPFTFCFNGLISGSGYTFISLISSCVSALIVRIPLVLLFGYVMDLGVGALGYAAPISTVCSALIGGIFFFSGKWKKDKLKIKRIVVEESI